MILKGHYEHETSALQRFLQKQGGSVSKFLISAVVLTGLLASAAQAQWLETTIPVGSKPQDVCYNSQNNKVYSANNGSATVTVIDGASNQLTRPWGSAPCPRFCATTRKTTKSIARITAART
jgi:YVTN family beta-propeller protein